MIETMKAVVTNGNGGYDKLEYRDVPKPVPGSGEVLIRVLAAGINNTEINTRLGWYSASVDADTAQLADVQAAQGEHKADGGWNEATPFPIIQGTDCCGMVEHAVDPRHQHLVGKRVLVRACMRVNGWDDPGNIWMASDFDGAFAQYVKVPGDEAFAIDSDWTDAQLATIPCAYATAENMVHRARVDAGSTVVVTGASGGVGGATVQLCKRRGAKVYALASKAKWDQLADLGADQLLDRDTDLVAELGEKSADVVIDNVAGDRFTQMLKILKRGGRYASSGAIAGPMVTMDIRDMYLKDISLIGCTAWDEPVFPNLIGYIERNEIKPQLAGTYPLAEIVAAQTQFMKKAYVGNFVLIPELD